MNPPSVRFSLLLLENLRWDGRCSDPHLETLEVE
jgi:hypothetical protein